MFTQVEFKSVLSHRANSNVNKSLQKAALSGFEKLTNVWGRPDYIIAQCSLPAGYLASILSQKYTLPFGVIEHFSFLGEQIQKEKSAMSLIYNLSTFVATVSTSLKYTIQDEFERPVMLIQNVISDKFVIKKRTNQKEFKWLYVGYNDIKKGPDILKEVLNQYPNMHLTIIGDGLAHFQCVDFINVKHIQSATREEMITLMSEHDALLSTSRIETFGMAIVEALASGLPVVATNSGGPDQYLTPDLGILCYQNAESVLKSIHEMENNYDKYDSLHISTSILTKFGAQNYIKQIETLLKLNDE